MLNVQKYQDKDLTYSEEGIGGGLIGFLTGVVTGLPTLWLGTAALGAAAQQKIQKQKQDIEIISERIAKLRNKNIDEAVKQGVKLPHHVHHIDSTDVIKGACYGFLFGPIYLGVMGSEIQDLNDELMKKIKTLEAEMRAAGLDPYGHNK